VATDLAGPVVPSEQRVTPSLRGHQAPLAGAGGDRRVVASPQVEPSVRKTEALDHQALLDMLQRRSTPAPGRVRPPPPVPSAELPRPPRLQRVSNFFTRATRSVTVPEVIRQRSIPPAGAPTQKTPAVVDPESQGGEGGPPPAPAHPVTPLAPRRPSPAPGARAVPPSRK
jgi:hypothetical protein